MLALRAAAAPTAPAAAMVRTAMRVSARGLAKDGRGRAVFSDREHALEEQYFLKQDKQRIENLRAELEKIESAAQEKAQEVAQAERAAKRAKAMAELPPDADKPAEKGDVHALERRIEQLEKLLAEHKHE